MVDDVLVTVEREHIDLPLHAVVNLLGEIFAVFDSRTQDSGHISYGVRDASGRRWFIKTPGADAVSPGGVNRAARSQALELSAEVSTAVTHSALIALDRIIDTDEGVVTVSAWFDGELLRAPAELRDDPDHAFSRFKSLPPGEVVAALDEVIDLHLQLDAAGWIAGDFYDGCLMYDFASRTIKVMDFECYHRGSYVNRVGLLPGSTRFMAPEERRRGAVIDSRTTVFNLGRMIEILLLERHPDHPARVAAAAATREEPAERPASLRDFHRVWRSAAGLNASRRCRGAGRVDDST